MHFVLCAWDKSDTVIGAAPTLDAAEQMLDAMIEATERFHSVEIVHTHHEEEPTYGNITHVYSYKAHFRKKIATLREQQWVREYTIYQCVGR